MHKINQLYAFVAVEEDGEGICGYMTENGWLPMVTSSEKNLAALRPIAQEIAEQTGKTVKLIKLEKRTDLEVLYGQH